MRITQVEPSLLRGEQGYGSIAATDEITDDGDGQLLVRVATGEGLTGWADVETLAPAAVAVIAGRGSVCSAGIPAATASRSPPREAETSRPDALAARAAGAVRVARRVRRRLGRGFHPPRALRRTPGSANAARCRSPRASRWRIPDLPGIRVEADEEFVRAHRVN